MRKVIVFVKSVRGVRHFEPFGWPKARIFDRGHAKWSSRIQRDCLTDKIRVKPRTGGVRSVKTRMFRRVLPPRWRFSTCGGWRRGDLEATSRRPRCGLEATSRRPRLGRRGNGQAWQTRLPRLRNSAIRRSQFWGPRLIDLRSIVSVCH